VEKKEKKQKEQKKKKEKSTKSRIFLIKAEEVVTLASLAFVFAYLCMNHISHQF
jgi:L-asparagine transporter-like permease